MYSSMQHCATIDNHACVLCKPLIGKGLSVDHD